MNILVFGKDGQLGRAFQNHFKHSQFGIGNTICFVGRSDCDLCSTTQITQLLEDFGPHLIINAAAYTAVDRAESESNIAFAVNAIAPQVMAKYAVQHGGTLLHFSTDYVFDGVKGGTYSEVDKTNPLSVYGKSKEAGEIAIANAFSGTANQRGQYAILRTSWVYGVGGNFIRTILRLAKERSALRVIDDQYGVPTSTAWLAELACNLTLEDGRLRKFTSGIYHAIPPGETNWYGVARLAIQAAIDFGWQLKASPNEITPIPTSEYPLPAPRPMNSRLSRNKLQIELERLALVSKLPHWNTPWDEQVRAYVKHLDAN
ncbi:dTDP-4-dehydrorhamnose reductase [Polynucleobacter sp. AP-Feld-500C-C5]|uniref:dTDP-4-dehydrorhamnose reductase n=1 Tax=Polynucleobacter sp. AP-Feld-500C-C5 TaxID=2576924 RepID=UPI001C0CD750|nr:dTDP-4-dehydrorhamnose reductase [Polynucleobacter sp. AP-Feld-500C-C5]MBU3632792.1 dTDP-4-dehydrorhamnose reductase [Polynucleobacter sp. AP-Feld-500C-C5]